MTAPDTDHAAAIWRETGRIKGRIATRSSRDRNDAIGLSIDIIERHARWLDEVLAAERARVERLQHAYTALRDDLAQDLSGDEYVEEAIVESRGFLQPCDLDGAPEEGTV